MWYCQIVVQNSTKKGAHKMEDILLNATLKEKISKKNQPYFVVEIELSPNVSKQVFLEPAEVELVKLLFTKSK